MKLWSFAITACRHFSSKAAPVSSAYSSKKKAKPFWWGKKYVPKTNKEVGTSRSKRVTKPKIIWTDEQNRVLEAVENKKSVFITGSAGTGKTFLLEQIIKKLKKIHGRSGVSVTASTGVAACALHGLTLHSFSGVGLGELDGASLLKRVLSDGGACRRWEKVKALVIDEASMVDAELFDCLALIARTLKYSEESSASDNKTWGGIQLIVGGDFFQLPPIVRGKRKKVGKVYAFEADCWSSSFDLQIELTKVFRQSDSLLVHLLQGIRRAQIDPDDMKLLVECCMESQPDPEAVRLFPRINDVDKVNKEKMDGLNQEIYVYTAQDSGERPWMRQLDGGMARDKLELCVGARVMLIKNKNPFRKLVNGATGTVLEMCTVDDDSATGMCSRGNVLPLVKFDSGVVMTVKPEIWQVKDGEKIVATRKQIPLILSWAISIHKCQGMSIDKLHTDLSRVFDCGMVYVALSRVRSLGGLSLSGLELSSIRAHPKVLEFYRSFSIEHNEKSEEHNEKSEE